MNNRTLNIYIKKKPRRQQVYSQTIFGAHGGVYCKIGPLLKVLSYIQITNRVNNLDGLSIVRKFAITNASATYYK